MSNSEWADFHEKFSALPLSEKFRGVSQIHDSWSNYIGENRDRRYSEQDHQAYTGLCRTLYGWTKIDQSPTHENDKQTALAEAISGDEQLKAAATKWRTLETEDKLAAMQRVQQLHAHIYGIEAAPKISLAPRYMNAGLGLDACYNHDHMFPERCENKVFDDTLDHFGDAVQATLHGASMRIGEHQRMDFFGGSDDTSDPAAVQGSMFHMDYFTSGDLWNHENGEFQRYTSRPLVAYARETAEAVMNQLQGKIDDAATTISDTKREAVYRLGKIEEYLTDGRVHDRDRSIARKIAAIAELSDKQISALSTGLKAHILADIQYEAAAYDHSDAQNKALQKQAFELGNRITRLTELEPDFVEHQQKLEEQLVSRMRRDPEISQARANWKKMSNDQRLSVLDRAMAMHAETFNYNKPPLETYDEPRNPETRRITNGLHYRAYGAYPDGKISINVDKESSFHDFQNAMNTVLHESTHALQNQLGAKFATQQAQQLSPAEKNQARQFFWTTKQAFYGNAEKIGYDHYKTQQMEKHAFAQGAVLAARVAAKPDLRERIDLISQRVRHFSQRVTQKVSLVRQQPKISPSTT